MTVPILVTVLIAVGTLIVGALVGFLARRVIAEKSIGSAEEQAKKILEDAIKNAESSKKEAIISAKEEIFQLKKEADFDIKERRKEVSRQERRLQQKEETLDAKIEGLERREAALQEKHQEADRVKAQIDAALEQTSILQSYSNQDCGIGKRMNKKPETDAHKYSQLISDKGARAIL